MGQSKINILFFLCIFGGCYSPQANRIINYAQKEFGDAYFKDSLFQHFPEKIKNSILIYSAPPYCPPNYECRGQFGDLILIVNKNNFEKELTAQLSKKIMYKSNYSDDNIIINLSELRKPIFKVEKCNKYFLNKLPIPYFERYDFGMGVKKTSKIVESELQFNYIYTIPSDLQVYVIHSEPGDFWKENCNEIRPVSLKEWQHGYSKGFAISEEKQIILFWVMIW